MSEFYIDPRSDIVLISVFAADFAIYWVFYRIAVMANAMRNREVIPPRLLACAGIVVLTALFIWYTRANLIDPVLYESMTPREQGEYLGGFLRTAVFPAILIIGISAARAWRDAQERKYRGKNV
ncbi:MAG: hypothetical protein IRY96_08480 [Burkholderiales bacterium]|nr:hypothetical protein [Burkholderiales bacterium]